MSDIIMTLNKEIKKILDDKKYDIQKVISNIIIILKTQGYKTIDNIKFIASGTFGAVFKCNLDNKTVAMKVLINSYENPAKLKNVLMEYEKEDKFIEKMSKLKISPTLYNIFTKYDNKYILHFVIMELYDEDCADALYKLSLPDKIDVVKKMHDLVVMQFDNESYCVDIKPNNFMYKYDTKSVKMIDFDAWCSWDIKTFIENNRYKPEVFLMLNLLQLYIYIAKSWPEASYVFLENPEFYKFFIIDDNYDYVKKLLTVPTFKGKQPDVVWHNISSQLDKNPKGIVKFVKSKAKTDAYNIVRNNYDQSLVKQLSKHDSRNKTVFQKIIDYLPL